MIHISSNSWSFREFSKICTKSWRRGREREGYRRISEHANNKVNPRNGITGKCSLHHADSLVLVGCSMWRDDRMCVWMHLVQRMQLRVVSSSQNDWPLGASPRYFSINLASDTSPAYHDTPRLHLHSKRDLRGDSIERVSHLSRIKNPRQSPFKIFPRIIWWNVSFDSFNSVAPFNRTVWFTNSIIKSKGRVSTIELSWRDDKFLITSTQRSKVYSTRIRHAFRRERTSNFIMSRDEVVTVLTWWWPVPPRKEKFLL